MLHNTKPKVVFIGGGTGLSTLLRGMKDYPIEISAIVAMTDDGMSTGRIRRDLKALPPGDIRKCLIALSEDENILTELFNYRFTRSKGLAGHCLGNLLLTALEKITGSFPESIAQLGKILNTKGRVYPSTIQNIHLSGELESGRKITGERKLFLKGKVDPIKKVWLTPSNVKANYEALDKIKNADSIVIGPGSLYTSILPNLLIKDITRQIIKNKKAKKIYICNVSTERGETQEYNVEDHIKILQYYSDKKIINTCLVNSNVLSVSSKEYKLGEINNITTNKSRIYSVKIISKDIIDKSNPLYHNAKKLAKCIFDLVK